jgi:hypothetical protein
MHRSRDPDQHNSADHTLTVSKAIASRGIASDAKAMGMATSVTTVMVAAAMAMVGVDGMVAGDGTAGAGTAEEGTAVATTSGF